MQKSACSTVLACSWAAAGQRPASALRKKVNIKKMQLLPRENLEYCKGYVRT